MEAMFAVLSAGVGHRGIGRGVLGLGDRHWGVPLAAAASRVAPARTSTVSRTTRNSNQRTDRNLTHTQTRIADYLGTAWHGATGDGMTPAETQAGWPEHDD